MKRALGISIAVALVGCHRAAGSASAAQPDGAQRGTLVIAAGIGGQLVPCGCSPDQLGGLPRAAAALKKIRAGGPAAFIDAGDLLFDAPPSPVMVEQAELKARTLAKGEAQMGAAARAVGARDLLRGAPFVASSASETPLLDAGGLPVAGARSELVVPAGPIPLGVLAGGLSPESLASLAPRAKKLREAGARVVILLFHPRPGALAGWTQAEALGPAASAAGIDLIVLSHREDPASDPEQLDPGPPAIAAPPGHMQKLLRIDLSLPADARPGAPLFLARGEAGKREALQRFDDRIARLSQSADAAGSPERKKLYLDKIAEQQKLRAEAAAAVDKPPAGAIVATASFVPLDDKAGEDLEAKALVAAYDDRVAAMNLAAAKAMPEACPAPEKDELSFTGVSAKAGGGVEGCASCHPTETKFWANTEHAHAYATLVKARKEFSLDCVRCHVTGWQQPGGVCRIDRTEVGGAGVPLPKGGMGGVGRRDVQCENCHGPGSAHAEDPPGHIETKIGKSTCMRCHEAANSPHFVYEKYLPGVVGPGHGKPLAKGQEPGPVWPSGNP